MKTQESLYARALITPSDINEHVVRLRELAALATIVTEFGVRYGVSTIALASGAQRLTSYDLYRQPQVTEIEQAFGDRFQFIQGDSLQVEIEPTNMLFIDTLHTRAQLKAELIRHESKVALLIVLHDTTTFGEHGEGGGEGLWPAVQEFVKEYPWTVRERYTHNNGLTVLARISDK